MARRILAVLLDFGDTLADQATEQRDDAGFMYGVELMPGARDLLVALRERGYRIGMIADGRADESAVLRARHALDALFDAVAISDEVGAAKPDRRLFEAALQRLGIAPEQAGRVVMLGNRLERDVRGANELGIVSVWIDWSPRYRKVAQRPGELPDHVIGEPLELLDVLDRLERDEHER